MPELPEVETVAQGLREQLLNREVIDISIHLSKIISGSNTQFKKKILNNAITDITRHGKYLFLHFKNSCSIIVHLRMTGQLFFVEKSRERDKHTHLEFIFKGLDSKLIYRDIRTFGRFTLIDTHKIPEYIEERKLGEDALKISKSAFIRNIQAKRICIKAALLDQKVIAGIGNIYADEILYREQINPLTEPKFISDLKLDSLLKAIKTVLKQAILKKGTTFSDYVNSYGEKGKFQLALKAYSRVGKPCKRCKTLIVKTKVVGRGTYFCPSCQTIQHMMYKVQVKK